MLLLFLLILEASLHIWFQKTRLVCRFRTKAFGFNVNVTFLWGGDSYWLTAARTRPRTPSVRFDWKRWCLNNEELVLINRLLMGVRLIQTESELLKELCKLSHTFGVIKFNRPKAFPALFFFICICLVVNVLRCKKGGNDCSCYSKEDHNENSLKKKEKRKKCLLKRLTLFDVPTVNPQKLSNQSAGGRGGAASSWSTSSITLFTETACVS